MADYPLIDGHKHDFSSVEVQVSTDEGAPEIITAVSELTYNQALAPGVVRGTKSQPLAFTQGKLEPGEGTLTLPLEDAQELRVALGNGYMTKQFKIVANYSATGSETITDELIGCRITDEETTGSGDSEDPILVTYSLMYLRGTRGGLDPVPNMLK